jgi:hypothetical protein
MCLEGGMSKITKCFNQERFKPDVTWVKVRRLLLVCSISVHFIFIFINAYSQT